MKCAIAQIAENLFRFDLVAFAVAAAMRVKGLVQSSRLKFLYDTCLCALGSLQSVAHTRSPSLARTPKSALTALLGLSATERASWEVSIHP